MWKKSLSEKIARVFEIVGYLQLIPAIPLVVLSAIFIFPLLISVPVFGIGLMLFVGYVKHSHATLSEGKILPLWTATFIFNFLPLLYLAFQYYSSNEISDGLGFFIALMIFWWIMACCLSLTAIYDEFIENKI